MCHVACHVTYESKKTCPGLVSPDVDWHSGWLFKLESLAVPRIRRKLAVATISRIDEITGLF